MLDIYMDEGTQNEQTNTTNENGTQNNIPLAGDGTPLSDYDKALALVQRREDATKAEALILDRKEKLAANAMLGGTAGGHVESTPAKELSAKEYRAQVNKDLAEGKYDRKSG